MSDEVSGNPGDLVETEELWSLQVQPEPDGPWVAFGMHNSDAASVLRAYDYRQENSPEDQCRIAKTLIQVYVEDPDALRSLLPQKPVVEDDTGLQSE